MKHKARFVLKGATLFSVRVDAPYRSTGDLDLLGFGENVPDALKAVFVEIAAIDPDPPDGLVFDTAAITADTLRADDHGRYRHWRCDHAWADRIGLPKPSRHGDTASEGLSA
ncbi:MAG TPA: hypothetical protein DHW63_09925 [Hyphomonadaceae bacterium]|nr:hypothetical protein [Hyphomonadaceae bacterium]